MLHSIRIGLTTAPRTVPTIDRTINSLRSSGWEHIHVFAEPDCPVPDGTIISRRKERQGAWANWFYGLEELVRSYDQPYYVMAQDDIVLCKGTYEFVSKLPMRSHICCYSLFTPRQYRGKRGWNLVDLSSKLWMAQMLVFPRETAIVFLDSPIPWRIPGAESIDNRVGMFARHTNRAVYYHTPSLVKHIGHTSTIWPSDVTADFNRADSDFVGEEFTLPKA